MKTILLIIGSATILTILFIAIKLLDTSSFSQFAVSIGASVIGSQKTEQFVNCIRKFSDKKMSDFSILPAEINSDSNLDAFVKFKTKPECGTAGCVVEICISEGNNQFTYVPFGFAAQTVHTMNTLTNGMHDLLLNNDPHLTMSFNGEAYVLSDTQN